MALVDPYQVTTPAGSDDPRDGDDRIRELKRALRERFTQGGIYFENSGTIDQDGGKICAGIQATNELIFYETDKTTSMADFNDSTKDLTLGDGKNGSNQYQLICHDIDVYDAAIANDMTVAGDLTITGQLDPNGTVSTPTIAGGTLDRDRYSSHTVTSQSCPVSTGTVIGTTNTGTISSDLSAPTRYFLLIVNFDYRSNTTNAVNDFDVQLLVDVDGGGYNLISTNSLVDNLLGPANTNPPRHFGWTAFHAQSSANGNSIRFRVNIVNNDATNQLNVTNFSLDGFEWPGV